MSEDADYVASDWQRRFHALPDREALGAGAAGPGKDLCVHTYIVTDRGLLRLGDIRIGDRVFDERGQPCTVVGTREFVGQPCYRLTFDDGTQVIAGTEHEWATLSYLERKALTRRDGQRKNIEPGIRTTAAIHGSLKHLGKTNHAVINTRPLQAAEADLPIDPWVVGQWLANGRKTLGKGFIVTSPEPEVGARLAALAAQWELRLHTAEGHGACTDYSVSGALKVPNPLVLAMRELFPDTPASYRIPTMYLRASETQRWELLRGLIDGDGHVTKTGIVQLTFHRKELLDDAYHLACSLGFKCTRDTCINRNPKTHEQTSVQHRLHFSAHGRVVSYVPHKQANVLDGGGRTQRWRYIVDAEPVPSVPTKCLTVDSPSHMFLVTEACIPTHNSLGLLADPISQIKQEDDRCFYSSEHPFPIRWGESIGWALHLRRTRPMLALSIARSKRLFPKIDPEVRWLEKETTWIFRSGYRYQFGHCNDPDDWDIYQSNEYTWIGYDELVQFNREQYDQINSRLRSSDPMFPFDGFAPRVPLEGPWHQCTGLRIRSCSNPNMKREKGDTFSVKDPRWVRERFVDPWPTGNRRIVTTVTRKDGTKQRVTRLYLPATLYDNPDKEFVRQYEATLLTAPDHIRKAQLEGDWYGVVDSYFAKVWDSRIHVCNPFKIPSHWRQFRTMDWGFKLPGVVHWWAIDDDDNLFCTREWRFRGMLVDQVAKELVLIEKKAGLYKDGRSLITGPADPQIHEHRGDIGKTKAEVFSEYGIEWTIADKGPGSIQVNAERVYMRLQDHDNYTTTPGLVFFATCGDAIRQIPAIQFDPNNPEWTSTGSADWAYDSTAYSCAYASLDANMGPPPDDDDDYPREREDESRGRSGYGEMY